MMQSSQKPILVTGATGFLASHCVKQLLEYGYKVRGTVRSLANKSKNQFLYGLVPEKSANLELVEADLLKPETWGPAVEGIDYILHVASPFPLEAPKHEDMVIKPAVEGTLSVLQAAVAKGAKKVVVTSSVAAVQYGNEHKVVGPEDWSVEKKCPPYQKSKLKAERAAWKFWEENKDKLEVVTILPGFIIGELFAYADGTSEKTVKDMLTGKMPGLPDWSIGVIDVRDVAEAHIKALFSTTSNGKRYMVAGETVSMKQMSQVLRDEYGKYGYKVTKMSVPNCLIKLMALFRKDAEALKADLGKQRRYNNERTEKELDMKFRSSTACFKEMADSLIRLGAVPNRLPKSEVGR